MSNLSRKQRNAADELERLSGSLFEALGLDVDYDMLSIRRGGTTHGDITWLVTIDNTNYASGPRVVCESGRTLREALSKAVGAAAKAHLIAQQGSAEVTS